MGGESVLHMRLPRRSTDPEWGCQEISIEVVDNNNEISRLECSLTVGLMLLRL